MKLRPGDEIAGMSVLKESEEDQHLLVITSDGYGKRVPLSDFKVQNRGGVGVICIKFKEKDDRLRSFVRVLGGDEILVITENGIVVRQKVPNISTQSRTATGVIVQKIDKQDAIKSISLIGADMVGEGRDEGEEE